MFNYILDMRFRFKFIKSKDVISTQLFITNTQMDMIQGYRVYMIQNLIYLVVFSNALISKIFSSNNLILSFNSMSLLSSSFSNSALSV